jgi:two-component system, LytTR family, response regulator
MRILIAEDQPAVREQLAAIVRAEAGTDIVAACANGREAVAQIVTHSPDVALLDIQMPEMTGFEVIEAVGADVMPLVIFVTAYDEHAVKAFEVHAFDYVLKPFSPARIAEALRRASRQLEVQDRATNTARLEALLRNAPDAPRTRVAVRTGRRVVFVRRENIDYVEASGNYAIIHAGGVRYQIRQTLTDIESSLGEGFARIHRARLVNLSRIREMAMAGRGEYDVVMQDGQRLRVTRLFRHILEEKLRTTP